jgi:hypothetical protein
LKLNHKSKSGLVESHPGIINTDYVSDLFAQLQASKSNSVTAAKAVMDSLRVMQSYAGNEVAGGELKLGYAKRRALSGTIGLRPIIVGAS